MRYICGWVNRPRILPFLRCSIKFDDSSFKSSMENGRACLEWSRWFTCPVKGFKILFWSLDSLEIWLGIGLSIFQPIRPAMNFNKLSRIYPFYHWLMCSTVTQELRSVSRVSFPFSFVLIILSALSNKYKCVFNRWYVRMN